MIEAEEYALLSPKIFSPPCPSASGTQPAPLGFVEVCAPPVCTNEMRYIWRSAPLFEECVGRWKGGTGAPRSVGRRVITRQAAPPRALLCCVASVHMRNVFVIP